MPQVRTIRALAVSAVTVLAVAACGAAASPSPTLGGGAASPAVSSASPALGSPGASASGFGASPSGGVAGTSATPLTSPAASPAASKNQAVVVLQPQGGSNIGGGAYVTEVSGGTAVSLGVVAPGVTDPMPAGIYEGTCAATMSGEPAFKLGDVMTGASNTTIDATLDELTSSPHVIAVLEKAGSDKVVSCGSIGGV